MQAPARPMLVRALVGGTAALLLAAACSSNSTTSPGAAPAATTGVASAGAASGGAATVDTKAGAAGDYLTDATGRTLYLWVADTSTTSTCAGSCASAWPPLTTNGAPQAGSGVQASLLGTSVRSDGTTQVTYAGHPLYYFADDTAPGDTMGQGSNGFGALWWEVTPAGAAITSTTGAETTPSAPAPAGGGASAGYGGY